MSEMMKYPTRNQENKVPEFHFGDGKILEVKRSHKILGVTVQDDLRWNLHVEEMVRKATRTTWVLRRMRSLGVDQTTLVSYWKAEGRVHLEISFPVWHSSLTASQTQDLERAQRVAMAAIVGRWEPSHTRQLQELGIERLEPRRQKLCRVFAQRTATVSRHTDLFTQNGFKLRKGKMVRLYREPVSRTATHYNSAVPYLTRLLNSAPDERGSEINPV